MEITTVALLMSVSLAVFGVAYYYITTRHRERMAILERGLPSDFFRSSASMLPLLLALGIICIGVCLGILAALCARSLEVFRDDDMASVAILFLFLGASMIVSYYVLRKIQ